MTIGTVTISNAAIVGYSNEMDGSTQVLTLFVRGIQNIVFRTDSMGSHQLTQDQYATALMQLEAEIGGPNG